MPPETSKNNVEIYEIVFDTNSFEWTMKMLTYQNQINVSLSNDKAIEIINFLKGKCSFSVSQREEKVYYCFF